ncbi:MAG: hypothetical protein EA369_09195 [Bradymonadales bacterium]|nr:MAG: hypothetical protein EA369_09195 [Bradymonadales bacterium]
MIDSTTNEILAWTSFFLVFVVGWIGIFLWWLVRFTLPKGYMAQVKALYEEIFKSPMEKKIYFNAKFTIPGSILRDIYLSRYIKLRPTWLAEINDSTKFNWLCIFLVWSSHILFGLATFGLILMLISIFGYEIWNYSPENEWGWTGQ